MRRTINFLFNLGENISEKKFSIGFLIDLSGSMLGEPLDQIKIAINSILKPLVTVEGYDTTLADEVSIMTFHTKVQKICPWVGKMDFDYFREFLFGIPNIDDYLYKGSGSTSLYDGLGEILNSCYQNTKYENERIILIFSDGCENTSVRYDKIKLKKLIKKYNQGFVEKDEILNALSLSSTVINKIFEKDSTDEYLIFKKELNDADIQNLDLTSEHRAILSAKLLSSRKPVKICSLYYKCDAASPRGKELLNDFAGLTGGVLNEAPSVDTIPVVMKELFHNLFFGDKTSIRSGLINRLNENLIDGNSDWHRVFSINSVDEPEDMIEDPEGHALFKNSIKGNNFKSRSERLSRFRDAYLKQGKLKQVLLSNFISENTRLKSVQANPYIFIVFRANDLSGLSVTQIIIDVLEEIRNNPQNVLGGKYTDFHTFIVLLTDNLHTYTDQDKKSLSAFLNEINHTDPDFTKVSGIFIISDWNHFTGETVNNRNGYKSLYKSDFEQLVIENLVNLNLHQKILDNIIGNEILNSRKQSDFYDRFLSIGSVLIKGDQTDFVNKTAKIFCRDLAFNLCSENYKTDEEGIEREIDAIFNEINYKALKNKILEGGKDFNLISKINCPSALDGSFFPFRKTIRIKYVNQKPSGEPLIEEKLNYQNQVEYFEYLFFDIRNYVESCDTPVFLNAEVQIRIDKYLTEILDRIRSVTDNLLYQGYMSSPRQAELWVDKLSQKLNNYTEIEISTDIKIDNDNKNISDFEISTSTGVVITDNDPEIPLNKLKEKIENFPLPLTLRTKYYLLAFLLASGFFTFFVSFGWPLLTLISLIVPAGIVIWAEYRIHQMYQQLRNLTKWYGAAHRNKARKIALEYLNAKINEFLVTLKEKIVKSDESPTIYGILPENLSEKDYVLMFRNSLLNSFVIGSEYEDYPSPMSSRFCFDIVDGFTDQNNNRVSLIDREYIYDLTGISSVKWDEAYKNILDIQDNFTRFPFPSVTINFIPPGLQDTLLKVSRKKTINLHLKVLTVEIIKERKYAIILLDELSSDEIKELKNIYQNKTWQQSIDSLVACFKNKIEVKNTNVFSLWREVGFYQAWLNKIGDLISHDLDNSDNPDTDYLFKLWKRMYEPRRIFRERLYEHAKLIWDLKTKAILDLWAIILKSAEKARVTEHIKSHTFPAVSLSSASGEYSLFFRKFYVSGADYSSERLRVNYGETIKTILNDDTEWSDYQVPGSNYLSFANVVIIPVNDCSLLQEIKYCIDPKDFMKKDGDWKKFFLEDFSKEYLLTEKQRKEFKWLFK